MNQKDQKRELPYTACPPEEFSGRFVERESLRQSLLKVRQQGQAVVVSGTTGSGKSSLINWAEYEIQRGEGGLENPAIKREFAEAPGAVFDAYRDLLTELKEHQQFGWFKKLLHNADVRNSIDVGLSFLKEMSSFAGPISRAGIGAGVTAVQKLINPQDANNSYSELLSSFLEILRNLSSRLRDNQFLTIICDDAQYSSDPEFYLLLDLIRNLPTRGYEGIAFVIAFDPETRSKEKYNLLQSKLKRYGHSEIRLSGMTAEETMDFAKQRYGLVIDKSTADLLSSTFGGPFSLVNCFNLLQRRNLEVNHDNIGAILSEALDPVDCIYSELDKQWRNRVNSLCMLDSPMTLSVIAEMLDETELQRITDLNDELEKSAVFKRLEKDTYDFAFPSMREYRRKALPEFVKTKLHAKAAKCLEHYQEGVYKLEG